MNEKLAKIAELEARSFYHGNHMGSLTNLHPISDMFPYTEMWNVNSWDNRWCAAFVFYCLWKSGYELQAKHPKVSRNFAWCESWEEWAKLSHVNTWYDKTTAPEMGDIVLFDDLFIPSKCDHIAIIINFTDEWIETAEGNFCNISAIVKRSYKNIRGYIRV